MNLFLQFFSMDPDANAGDKSSAETELITSDDESDSDDNLLQETRDRSRLRARGLTEYYTLTQLTEREE